MSTFVEVPSPSSSDFLLVLLVVLLLLLRLLHWQPLVVELLLMPTRIRTKEVRTFKLILDTHQVECRDPTLPINLNVELMHLN